MYKFRLEIENPKGGKIVVPELNATSLKDAFKQVRKIEEMNGLSHTSFNLIPRND
ncbi:MAG: hypothetical protein IKN74_01040 [Clostridia bacterium]|nr:hypothetical protein [Bacilli bacterium]MBR3511528.1 hypothetical protein [Clostridia bacterium]